MWYNTVKSWANICWTSQIALRWTIWNHKTISSENVFSTSVPNTKYCQEVLPYFTLSSPNTWEAFSDSMDPLCLFSSAEIPTLLPQFIAFTHYDIMILQRNFNQKVVVQSMVLYSLKKQSWESPFCFIQETILLPSSDMTFVEETHLSDDSFNRCWFRTCDEMTTQI